MKDIDFFLGANTLHKLSEPFSKGHIVNTFLGPLEVRREPKGIVLVMAPSNFPIMLALNWVVAAVAAGNCVVLKPSEFTPASEMFLKGITDVLDNRIFDVIVGDVSVAKELLAFPWKHIIFTGSSATAKHVMRAAAEHLTPVTLELGGKNPVVVAKDAVLATAANSIVQTRFLNAGQICLAPVSLSPSLFEYFTSRSNHRAHLF